MSSSTDRKNDGAEGDWQPLGAVKPTTLGPTRLAVHDAAHPLAAAAYALLEMLPDHSHTNLMWSATERALVGRALPSGVRTFLDPAQLAIGLLNRDGSRTSIDLAGASFEEGFARLAKALAAAGETVPGTGLTLPEYDLPPSSVRGGSPFPAPTEANAELARWFHNGSAALGRACAEWLGGAELRGWPHHFDLAGLLTLDPGLDPEQARSIGVGLSPGDGSYDEPYFYVAPWPYPPSERLPELPGGAHWHTEGFTAAVLTGSRVVAAEAEQAECVRAFLGAAIGACRSLLGA